MKIRRSNCLNKLPAQAQGNLFKRQHRNIHYSGQDPFRGLINAKQSPIVPYSKKRRAGLEFC